MNKEEMYTSIQEKYDALKIALKGTNIEEIRSLALEVHAMVHPSKVSGSTTKTVADYVLDYMLSGNQNSIVPREDYGVNLKYAGTSTVPLCWQFWHIYRIEDLVSNIIMMNQSQIFNDDWQRKIGSSITDTGNALTFDEAVAFGKELNVEALREYMIVVGKNTRSILEKLTLEQVQAMVSHRWVMRVLEEGGVTSDFRSVWLLVYWGSLTRAGMILTPLTAHHMMHIVPSLNTIKVLD